MSTEDPKALLAKAEKQIATAKDALAETDRIRRLKVQIEKEHAALLDTADPEDRAQMRKLGELNADLQVIPRREEKTLEKHTQAGLALCETAEQMSRTIQTLHTEEVTERLDKIEAVLRPYFRDLRQGNGDTPNRARGIAHGADIFDHMRSRITPTHSLPVSASTDCHNDPTGVLPGIIAHVHDLLIILSEYQAHGKSFVAPAFKKAA